ncbi:BnaC04g24190D [Brassica napus]|uniref:BnaC04g24190D protein n=3 Tax=Brassica TaxID=3705 RepID=A0A078GX00_BRANA|nr:BnaC04g24190D [Brassica napus]VDD09602.1 unnamed protein product [Brassica oleracea]
MVCSLSMIYVSVSVKTFCQTLIPVKKSSVSILEDAGCNDVIAEYRIDQVNQCSNFTIVFLITVIFRAELEGRGEPHSHCTLVDAFKFQTTENLSNRYGDTQFQTRSLEKLNEFVQQVSPEVIIPSVNFGHDSVTAMVFTLVT